jgi:hypothetical protein
VIRKRKCPYCGGKVKKIEPRTCWTPHGEADVTHQCSRCQCLFGEGPSEQPSKKKKARQEED